jgi:hypothetical protein
MSIIKARGREKKPTWVRMCRQNNDNQIMKFLVMMEFSKGGILLGTKNS